MLSFPVSHAVSLDFCYEFGDLTAVQDMLRNFTTNNMRIDLLTKSFTKEEETQEGTKTSCSIIYFLNNIF